MLNRLKKNLSNIPGWRTKRKLLVIESDDWGSIRMPSADAYQNMKAAGLFGDKGEAGRYSRYDTLASREDLGALFDVLNSLKDIHGRHPVFTAVSLVANPDFDRIKKEEFRKYHYETFDVTLERYGKKEALALWREGTESGLFVPEFHGREHLNGAAWMRALQNGEKDALLAFEQGMWAFDRKSGVNFQAAFDLERQEDLQFQEKAIREGLELFETLHGYRAQFFVPPNGPFNNTLEEAAAGSGIKYMSSPKVQTEVLGGGSTRRHFRYLGKKNRYGQDYITRNAFFEPSARNSREVENCLEDIELAFRWGKPAVLSSHRVNYIGGLDPKNRDHGLKELNRLLTGIVKRWPDVEFMTSTELGDIIAGKKDDG